MAAEIMRITEELVVDDRTGPGFASVTKKVSAFDKTLQQTQSRLNKMTGSRWNMTLNAVDKATQVISTVERKISSAAGKAWNFTVGLIDKATAPLQGIFNMLRNPILQAGAVLGISVSTKDVLDTFGGFESTMSQVKAISGATTDDMAALTALAKEMGSTTKFTAQEAAQGLTYMAMAGWKTEDMLTSLSGVMNLAAASGEDLATVSDIVTDAMTAFGLSASGTTASGVSNAMHFSDVLAAASSNANTNVSMMGETFKYVGSMAGAMGYSIEDVALATGLMANSGIKGTMAGTALNSMLTRLSTNTSGAADAISALGVEFYNSDGSARPLLTVMTELRRATVNMTAAQKSELANTVAGMEAQKGLLSILNTSEEDYNKLTEAIYNADGAAQQMSDTMLDNMQGSMTLLQSAVDGVKLALGERLSPYVRQFADWLTTKMPAVESVVGEVMDFVDGKIAGLRSTIAEFTASDEWANADVWGKLSIAWDKIVAEPFSAWWDSTGKPWLTEKIAGFGETLGSGITAGLLALLGFDASGAVEDGKSIGASFIEGFKSGFDMDSISEALTEWASDHKGVVAAAGVIAGGKLLGGISRGIQAGKSVVGDIAGLFGKGSSGAGAGGGGGGGLLGSAVSTMTVTAATVNIYGGLGGGGGAAGGTRTALQALTGAGGTPALPAAGGGALALPGATTALPGASAAVPALPGTAAAAGGGITSAGSWLSKILTAGSKSSIVGADGTLLAVQGGVGGALGSVGGALGSGATTAAGAAAAGAGSIAGILGGILGIGSGIVDIVRGTGKSGKDAKDSYVKGGTKIGMVGAGAGIGAAIGSVVPVIGTGVGAAVGAGIGGIGALLGGSSIGKALSDATDEGGALNNIGKAIGGFFTETLPEFITQKIPEAASAVGSAISDFAGKVGETVGGFFTETIPTFLTEQVPYAIGYVVGAAGTFFTQTVPEFFTGLFTDISTFFTSTLPAWVEGVAQRASTFFTETVPAFFGDLFTNVGTFFTETLPTWVEGVAEKASTFFGETVPEFFGSLWDSVTGFVTETIPEWANTAYDKIATFFTETIPGFFGNLWDGVTGFVTKTLPEWGSSIASTVSGWFGKVKDWFGGVWDTVSGAFSAGKSAGASAAGAHAQGGIMNAPHLAQVAEDGPEAIIPLGGGDRARGISVWQQAGDILGANQTDSGGTWNAGSNDTGIMDIPNTGGARSVGSNDTGARSIGSNDDGTGDIPPDTGGPDGGDSDGGDPDVFPTGTGGGTPGDGTPSAVNAPINITLNPEIVIQGTQGMSADDIFEVIKDRIKELVDDISDEMAERLARIFANMPVKGGA